MDTLCARLCGAVAKIGREVEEKGGEREREREEVSMHTCVFCARVRLRGAACLCARYLQKFQTHDLQKDIFIYKGAVG